MIIAWKIVSGCCKPMQGAGPCGSVFTAKNFWDPDLAFRRTLLVQNENAFFNSVFWDCIFHMHIGSCHNPRWGVKTNWDRIRLGSKPQHWQGVINISNFLHKKWTQLLYNLWAASSETSAVCWSHKKIFVFAFSCIPATWVLQLFWLSVGYFSHCRRRAFTMHWRLNFYDKTFHLSNNDNCLQKSSHCDFKVILLNYDRERTILKQNKKRSEIYSFVSELFLDFVIKSK